MQLHYEWSEVHQVGHSQFDSHWCCVDFQLHLGWHALSFQCSLLPVAWTILENMAARAIKSQSCSLCHEKLTCLIQGMIVEGHQEILY